jgi:hypothetical protein
VRAQMPEAQNARRYSANAGRRHESPLRRDRLLPLLRFGRLEELVQTLVKLQDVVARDERAWISGDAAGAIERAIGQRRARPQERHAIASFGLPLSISVRADASAAFSSVALEVTGVDCRACACAHTANSRPSAESPQ